MVNAIPMIGRCMKLQQDNDVTCHWTIAWTPDLYVATENSTNCIPVLMLKVDGWSAQER
jgi:hypothetical protein